MGIYDRDYYRREGPSFLGVIADTGTACKWIIGLNVLFFLIQMGTRVTVPAEYEDPETGEVYAAPGVIHKPGFFENAFVLDVDKTLHGQVWRLLTYAFLHSTSTVWHIVWNMLILWWFGKDVEDLYGTREFVVFYLVSAVVSGVVFCATTVLWSGAQNSSALGASGAVTAALVLCALHYPTRLIYVFFFLPVPIWLFVIVTVAQDAFHTLNNTHNGIASAAHVGGAAFAFAYYKLHWRLTSLLPAFQTWQKRRSQPRLRVYRGEERPAPVGVTAAPPPPPPPKPKPSLDDEHLEAKVDAVLEKLSRVGMANLSESEREVLRRGSERFKRRRT
jgi:membrane associated rhomboid family serine protease